MLPIKPELRRKVLKHLLKMRELSYKVVGARSGRDENSIWNQISRRDRRRHLDEEGFQEILADLGARPAHAAVVAACLESLEALDQEDGLTPEERDEREMRALELSRTYREGHTRLALLARSLPPLDRYPEPGDVEPIRWLAREQIAILKEHEDYGERLAIVQRAAEYQHWGLAEAAADESEEAASRSLEEAAAWTELAVASAERTQGPEEWQRRVRAYAGGCVPNTLRVKGELAIADVALQEVKSLWEVGSDPDGVLDPGRLLDLEGSLRRAQRRFPEALARLKEAREVSHNPARVLIKVAFTQEVTGDYEGALDSLREAESLVKRQREPRLYYMLRFNLAACCTHLGLYVEADTLLQEVREAVTARGDENEVPRVTGLQGKIEVGLGRRRKGRGLIEQALQQFHSRELHYDAALLLLELAMLLLDEGKTAEVKSLTLKLAKVFDSKKIHREALAALKLFREAAEKEAADEEFARRILNFLYRARHDQGLEFEL